MDHITQFDWYSPEPYSEFFIEPHDIDNSAIEKILRNKFRDPLLSSDSEDESKRQKIDWNAVFKTRVKKADSEHRVYVPALRAPPPYPKVSALTKQQHLQCLKVLCAENRHVLQAEFLPRPTKTDHRVFQEVKEIYAKEQSEYKEWAKSQWVTTHSLRALRPKPYIEKVYEAEFKVRANELQSFPRNFELAAQIPLEPKCQSDTFEMVLQKELISVNIKKLPQIQYPDTDKKYTILRQAALPEPCNKHPCRFILPNEKAVTVLPVCEVYRELGQYAADCGAEYIVSERALKCLLQHHLRWALPVAVHRLLAPDGELNNVVVIGSGFSVFKESAQTRTYKAMKHLLELALVPASERMNVLYDETETNETQTMEHSNFLNDMDSSDDEREDTLFIDDSTAKDSELEEMDVVAEDPAKCGQEKMNGSDHSDNKENESNVTNTVNHNTSEEKLGIYSCTCKDTVLERPPPRSFSLWCLRGAGDTYDVIVHCAHKLRDESEEIIAEPIVEYQLELGGCKLPEEQVRSLALSLHLRKNAALLEVRVEAGGDVVRADQGGVAACDVIGDVSRTLHTALGQLRGLLPGCYVLDHEPSHGANALLYVAKATGAPQQLALAFDGTRLAEADEAKSLRAAPVISTVLLPYHKYRKVLPCAFTPHPEQVARDTRKPGAKQKPPPQALKLDAEEDNRGSRRKWPKRSSRKKKNK